MSEHAVLLVEDDPHLRLGCEQAFEIAGIPAVAVGSAEEARRHLDGAGVDVVGREGPLGAVAHQHHADQPPAVVLLPQFVDRPADGRVLAVGIGGRFLDDPWLAVKVDKADVQFLREFR